jgi:glutamate formiminotransferase
VKDVLLAVPNISEGRDRETVAAIAGRTALLDVSSDHDHNRSVLTFGGEPKDVLGACLAMIERAVARLDINAHHGAHPRHGVVDVLPFVAYRGDEAYLPGVIADLIWRIDQGPGVPTYTYGRANEQGRTLPELRRALRSEPHVSHPTAGVICIGVRDPLIAFNVNCLGPLDAVRNAARDMRGPAVRALAFELPSRGEVQLSMNLIDLAQVGPAQAFESAVDVARRYGLQVIDAEVVGHVPAEYARELRRLPLRWPVRTIEEALGPDSIGP